MTEVFEIIRKSLEAGQAVEIEGLGRFHATAEGYRFDPEAQPTVFVAYASEDLELARRLAEALRAADCSPWLDKDRLMPGQHWTRSIERAIQEADAFVACFSKRSVSKRGQFQSELRHALACAEKRPLDDVFLLPVRLETCVVPQQNRGAGAIRGSVPGLGTRRKAAGPVDPQAARRQDGNAPEFSLTCCRKVVDRRNAPVPQHCNRSVVRQAVPPCPSGVSTCSLFPPGGRFQFNLRI